MNILIIDDHPLTCQGLQLLLGTVVLAPAHSPQVRSVHSAAAAREALLAPAPPDWVFLDIRLPDDPDRQLFQGLCDDPVLGARTVLMSADLPLPVVRQALGAGLRGFIPKSADPAMVLAGFEAVRRGEVYLPPDVAAMLAQAPTEPPQARSLSPRLREVLACVLSGASNKVIARQFGLSENTVKEYMSSILAYHGVSNRLALVLKLKGSSP